MVDTKLKPDVIADLYLQLQDDSVSFEKYPNPLLQDFLRSSEIARIATAREIHEFVDAVENSSAAGFDLKLGWPTTVHATQLSGFYSRVGQAQSIFNPMIRYSEQVECFHHVCFDMGLAKILLPADPVASVYRFNQDSPNESLITFLGIPARQPAERYLPPAQSRPNRVGPVNVGFGGQGTYPGSGTGNMPWEAQQNPPLSGAAVFNELVRRIRGRLASREYKTDVYAREHQCSNLAESCGEFVDTLLAKKITSLRAFSIDFGYAFGRRDAVDLAQARKDTAKLLSHKKLAGRLGYVRKRQFGVVRRHYFHMKLFFETTTTKYQDQLNEIRFAWENDVTGGNGVAFDTCNSECTSKAAGGDVALGQKGWKLRNDLLQNLDYLCYSQMLAAVDNISGRVKPIVTGGETGTRRKT